MYVRVYKCVCAAYRVCGGQRTALGGQFSAATSAVGSGPWLSSERLFLWTTSLGSALHFQGNGFLSAEIWCRLELLVNVLLWIPLLQPSFIIFFFMYIPEISFLSGEVQRHKALGECWQARSVVKGTCCAGVRSWVQILGACIKSYLVLQGALWPCCSWMETREVRPPRLVRPATTE